VLGDSLWPLPIHPVFVHLPIAMLTTVWALTLLHHATGSLRWARPIPQFEWVGVAFLPFTIMAGVRDASGLTFLVDPDVADPLLWHVVFALAAAVTFTGHAFWSRRLRAGATGGLPALHDVGLTTLGFWLLLMTGLFAGEVVFG